VLEERERGRRTKAVERMEGRETKNPERYAVKK